MATVEFVSGAKKGKQLRVARTKVKRLDHSVVEAAFGAKPVALSSGHDLFAIREAMGRMLQSSGGRPALRDAASQVKIPKISADWEKLERLAQAASQAGLRHKPSPGQMAAMVLHLSLSHMSDEDLKVVIAREFA